MFVNQKPKLQFPIQCTHHHNRTVRGCFSLRFDGHFPGGSGLAGTRMFPLWILLELRMMEVVVTTGAITHAKLQTNHHHKQANSQRFTGQMPFLSPNQCHITEGKTVRGCLWLR